MLYLNGYFYCENAQHCVGTLKKKYNIFSITVVTLHYDRSLELIPPSLTGIVYHLTDNSLSPFLLKLQHLLTFFLVSNEINLFRFHMSETEVFIFLCSAPLVYLSVFNASIGLF